MPEPNNSIGDYLLFSGLLSKLVTYELVHLLPSVYQKDKYYYSSHFTSEETEMNFYKIKFRSWILLTTLNDRKTASP